MNSKVFIKIFFESPKYFLIYALMITTFWYVLFIGVADSMFAAHYEKETPDIEITGKVQSIDSLLYEDLDPSLGEVISNQDTKIYGLTARNLYTFSDAFYQVSYRIYGADYAFIENLEKYLKKGKLPEAGKREILIGSNLAKYLNAPAGGTIKIPFVTGRNSYTEYEYVVAGVLHGDLDFYSDGIYIPDTSLPQTGEEWTHNVLYIFTRNNNAYNKVMKQLDGLGKASFGEVLFHRTEKASLYGTMIKALAGTIPFSTVFLAALFLSLMKDTGRKIGLMKALGLSDRVILILLVKGFGVFNICGIMNSFIAMGFIRLTSEIPLPVWVYLYTICSYGIILLVTFMLLFIMCKTISPAKAMYQF